MTFDQVLSAAERLGVPLVLVVGLAWFLGKTLGPLIVRYFEKSAETMDANTRTNQEIVGMVKDVKETQRGIGDSISGLKTSVEILVERQRREDRGPDDREQRRRRDN